MARAYFVSDLHLDDPEGSRSLLFERLLAEIAADSRTTHLFLLGDVFDMWLGDHDYFIERYRRIVDALAALGKRGIEIHYFEGNHDLHLRPFWAERLGVHVHPDPVHVELAGLRLRLEHGDQMDPDDRGYRFLRWFLRTPPVRFLILNLPGGVVARIGERASAHSRAYTSGTKTISEADAIEKIRAHARKVHEERPFDLIISGHVHVRDDLRFETPVGEGRSINLGTWLDRPCFLRIDDGLVELIELDKADVAQSAQPAQAVNESFR